MFARCSKSAKFVLTFVAPRPFFVPSPDFFGWIFRTPIVDLIGSVFMEFSRSTLGAPVDGSGVGFDRIVDEESELSVS